MLLAFSTLLSLFEKATERLFWAAWPPPFLFYWLNGSPNLLLLSFGWKFGQDDQRFF